MFSTLWSAKTLLLVNLIEISITNPQEVIMKPNKKHNTKEKTMLIFLECGQKMHMKPDITSYWSWNS